MQLAVICPPSNLDLIHRRQYQMVLAQHLITDPDYLAFYITQRTYDSHIIMDNGAAENQQVSAARLGDLAKLVGANEVCLRDVMYDSSATLEATCDPSVLYAIEPDKRMVVPQGRSVGEWFACLTQIVNRIEFASIGVPKHLENVPGGRKQAIRLVLGAYGTRWNIHLLGVAKEPVFELASLVNEYGDMIRSVDTGAPIAYAQNDMFICDCEHHSLKWTGDLNYVLERAVRARVNIEILDRICSSRLYSPTYRFEGDHHGNYTTAN